MKDTIRILHLEDNSYDQELIHIKLRSEGSKFKIKCIQTYEDFIYNLKKYNFDLILADYNMPQFNGLTALIKSKQIKPDIPFILVSGAVCKELADKIMELGATDCVYKDKLDKLIPSIKKALKKKSR